MHGRCLANGTLRLKALYLILNGRRLVLVKGDFELTVGKSLYLLVGPGEYIDDCLKVVRVNLVHRSSVGLNAS